MSKYLNSKQAKSKTLQTQERINVIRKASENLALEKKKIKRREINYFNLVLKKIFTTAINGDSELKIEQQDNVDFILKSLISKGYQLTNEYGASYEALNCWIEIKKLVTDELIETYGSEIDFSLINTKSLPGLTEITIFIEDLSKELNDSALCEARDDTTPEIEIIFDKSIALKKIIPSSHKVTPKISKENNFWIISWKNPPIATDSADADIFAAKNANFLSSSRGQKLLYEIDSAIKKAISNGKYDITLIFNIPSGDFSSESKNLGGHQLGGAFLTSIYQLLGFKCKISDIKDETQQIRISWN